MQAQLHEQLLENIRCSTSDSSSVTALLLLDIEDLTTLQARFGFTASALLLDHIASGFNMVVGERGTVLRLSDGRFCVLLHGIRNSGHATLAAKKLLRAAESAMPGGAGNMTPQIRVGIALFPLHSREPEDLLRVAQLALVAAGARNCSHLVYDAGCANQVIERWDLGETFASALENGSLDVNFQPKVRIADQVPIGAEALLRWMKDGKPVASPDIFIQIAEEAGLIHDTTWFVLTNSLRQAAEWIGLGVAVNISPSMLHHREFVEMIRAALAAGKVSPDRLTLEITEGSLIADFDGSKRRLSKIRDLGVRVSIDDFGTGYSSLNYFKKIPADELKIDKSFITRMLQDDSDLRLVETILTIARQFGLEVVAEGVERAEVLDRLRTLGCDYAQGYLFAPALSAPDIIRWLSTNSAPRTYPTISAGPGSTADVC